MERRTSPRAATGAHAVVFANNQRVRARSFNISQSGIGVVVPPSFEFATYLRVNFALHSPEGKEQWFDADGRVARVLERDRGFVLGIEFTVVESHVVAQIGKYVGRKASVAAFNQQLAAERKRSSSASMPRMRTSRALKALTEVVKKGDPDVLRELGLTSSLTATQRRTTEKLHAIEHDRSLASTTKMRRITREDLEQIYDEALLDVTGKPASG